MRIGILYKLTFQNGKVYIGITRETLEQRLRRHIAYARSGKSYALSCAIRKYGEKSFIAELISGGSWDELMAMEIAMIKECNSFGPAGYNMTKGGEGSLGVAISSETKEKISKSLTGRKLSDIHRARVGAAQKGKVISEETKEKMRLVKRGGYDRKPMSEGQREKIRVFMLGKKQSPELVAKRVQARMANGSYKKSRKKPVPATDIDEGVFL